MDTTFKKSENSKFSYPCNLLLKLTHKINSHKGGIGLPLSSFIVSSTSGKI